MESKKACSVTRISNYKVRRHFHTLAKQHEASLPSPSSLYSNIIFLFDEALATKGRELRIPVIPITRTGFIRSPVQPNPDYSKK